MLLQAECLLPGVPCQAARADGEEKLSRSGSHLSEYRAAMLKKDEEAAALRESLDRLVTQSSHAASGSDFREGGAVGRSHLESQPLM